jgi:rhamnose transport system permease protein
MMRPARTTFGFHEGVLLLLLALVLGVAGWLEPTFITPRTQLDIGPHAFELALLALPMTLVIISGGIDLSVGSTMALASVALGLLYQAHATMWLACAGSLAVGTGAGALNGFFVARVRVHPLLITLATLAAYRGLAEGISRARPVSGFPDGFLELGSGTALGVPIPVLILVPAVLATGLVASQSVWGTWIYAIGGNERAARYCGLPVDRVKFLLYTLTGSAAALCAIVFAARRNTAKADVGSGIELEVITAVVLGGTSIFGGRGTIIGTVLGFLLVHELREFISWRWEHDEIILIVIGATLIGSVLLTNLIFRPQST